MSETQVTAPVVTPKKHGKRHGPRRMSMSTKVRRALDRGEAPMAIAKRLKISTSAVYKIRYKMKAETQGTGIASLPTQPPTGGIVTLPPMYGSVAVQVNPPTQPTPAEAATEVAPAERPTLWQRIKLYVWGKK